MRAPKQSHPRYLAFAERSSRSCSGALARILAEFLSRGLAVLFRRFRGEGVRRLCFGILVIVTAAGSLAAQEFGTLQPWPSTPPSPAGATPGYWTIPGFYTPYPAVDLAEFQLQSQVLPHEILYQSYLAGPKEPRLGTQLHWEADERILWDTTLGGRFGWFRLVSPDRRWVWQVDVEGAAVLRLDADQSADLESVDYRFGLPLTAAMGPNRFKIGYEHLSAHLGDEFLLRNPGIPRENYVRDAIVAGYARYLSERIRVYGEASWAFSRDVADPWQFQVGAEYAPTRATGALGAPFLAVNGLLREEVDFGGTLTVHAGWAWRQWNSQGPGRLLRAGAFYQTGKSSQQSFPFASETQYGLGAWYDY